MCVELFYNKHIRYIENYFSLKKLKIFAWNFKINYISYFNSIMEQVFEHFQKDIANMMIEYVVQLNYGKLMTEIIIKSGWLWI